MPRDFQETLTRLQAGEDPYTLTPEIATGLSIPRLVAQAVDLRVSLDSILERGEASEDQGAIDELLGRAFSSMRLSVDTAQAHLTMERRNWWGLSQWAAHGFQRVQLSHRLAAMLAATTIGDPQALEMPWPTFMVEIPRGLLPFVDENGNEGCIAYLLITRWLNTGEYLIRAHGPYAEAYAVDTLAGLLTLKDVHGTLIETWPEGTDLNARSVLMAMRMVAGAALMVTTNGLQPQRVQVGSRGPRRRRAQAAPTTHVYRLTKDIKLDVRECVTSYIRHGGSTPSVQSLVAGHWKRQAYGTGNTLRRWVFIEPYWRGPENAPIAVRSHQLD